jgi:hypothetical protein
MESARKIVDLALSFEGWVFGGYVRDNVVLKLNQVRDIDIVFPDWVEVDLFIKTLGIFFDVRKYYDKTRDEGLYMSKCAKRLIKLEVDEIDVDIVIINGELSTWCNEYSTDLSCNLFYMTSKIPLGIRYTPPEFKHKANVAKFLIHLAKKKLFVQLYGPGSDNYDEKNMDKVERRVQKMEDRGWIMTCTCC